MRRISSLGALGEGSGWDQRIRPPPAPAAYVGGPKPEIWDPKKIQKIQILKIKIRSAQNVGKVFLCRKKSVPAPFGAIWAHFLRGPEKSKNCQNFAYFPWWANGPYSPGLGPCWDLFPGLVLRARVQGEGLVHGVWNKVSEDLENQCGGSEDRENLIWQAALGIQRKCIIQGSKYSV